MVLTTHPYLHGPFHFTESRETLLAALLLRDLLNPLIGRSSLAAALSSSLMTLY